MVHAEGWLNGLAAHAKGWLNGRLLSERKKDGSRHEVNLVPNATVEEPLPTG